MKSLCRFFLLAIPVSWGIAGIFIACNNLAALPWEICRMLWYAFLPLSAFAVALIYGLCRLPKGGGIIGAALFIAPLIVICHKIPLPFSDFFTAVPPLIAAGILTLFGEIRGRSLPLSKRKRRNLMDSAAEHSPYTRGNYR